MGGKYYILDSAYFSVHTINALRSVTVVAER